MQHGLREGRILGFLLLATSLSGALGCRSAVKDFYEPLLDPPEETDCLTTGSGGSGAGGGTVGGMDAGCGGNSTTTTSTKTN